MLQKLRRSEGFTLLELLVVVAIIAILATLILTNLNRARRQAQDAEVQSEVKAISDSVQLYITANPNGLPAYNGQVTATAAAVAPLLAPPDPLLRSLPVHPANGSTPLDSYRITTAGSGPTFTYTVKGQLPAKSECFTITDGTFVAVPAGQDCN